MQRPLIAFAFALLILFAITLAVQFRWMKPGRFRTGLVFTCGVLVIVALRVGGAPPDWFDGGWEGFGMAVGFLLAGVVTNRGEERAFGLPLFLGLGLTLFALNVAQLVRNVG